MSSATAGVIPTARDAAQSSRKEKKYPGFALLPSLSHQCLPQAEYREPANSEIWESSLKGCIPSNTERKGGEQGMLEGKDGNSGTRKVSYNET